MLVESTTSRRLPRRADPALEVDSDPQELMPRLITVEGGVRPAARRHLKVLPGYNFLIPVGLAEIAAGGIRTDMHWVYEWGIPGVFIYTPTKYYHTELDTREWVPDDDLQSVAEAVAELARDLRAEVPAAPTEIMEFELRAAPGGGDTVEFEVEAEVGSLGFKGWVYCYYELGYEKKVKLERGDDGKWRAGYRPPWPGEWQFLAAVSRGGKHGKRWATVTVAAKSNRD